MADRVRLTERDIRLLGIFRVLAEAGGLTAAEAQLGMELARRSVARFRRWKDGLAARFARVGRPASG